MRRLVVIILALAGMSGAMNAQHWVSVGLRGGAGTQLTTGDIQSGWAPTAMVDASYTYLWPVNDVELGIQTGLSLGYIGGRFSATVDEQYRNIDYLGHPMDYHNTTSSARESVDGMAMEIPAMMAFRWNGLVLNAGLKLQVPLWYQFRQQLTDPVVRATYPEYNVTTTNELITGVVDPADVQKSGRRDLCDVSLLLGLELGYEWTITEQQDKIGLVGYFDGAPYGHSAPRTNHVIDVAPISDPVNPVPDVTVNTIVGTYAQTMNYLSFGVKVYYRFGVPRLQPVP